MNGKDYIEFWDKVLEKMEKLSTWRFWALWLLAAVIAFIWRLPEILTALK
ncbi:hypothetical protein [Neisseria animalis]|nr:hypothetical protein [Neisseria animalis]VEE07725.1 Uncharacterised protein [Neisseria animalis]